MLISHEGRWIFFACSKTGTTSIEAALGEYDEGESIRRELVEKLGLSDQLSRKKVKASPAVKHIRPYLFRQFVPAKIWDEYYKFVFVRNPWDWVVSQYFFNFKPGYLKRMGVRKFTPKDVLEVRQKLARIRKVKREPWVDDGGFQHAYVTDRDGSTLVDYVGRFENLENDFKTVCKTIGVQPVSLPVINTTEHKMYRKHYTAASRDAVYDAYRKDIELFDYEY
jgi:hypothetical protein